MSILKLLSAELDQVLNAAGVFDIGSYGWLNAEDPDPSFIGHAMWQTDQPYVEYEALLGQQQVSRRPLDLESDVLTLGEDFCALLQASRLSIGLMLLWEKEENACSQSAEDYFWSHHLNAFLTLATAAERLRDLMIVSCTGKSAAVFRDAARRNRLYVTPFEDAQLLLLARGISLERLAGPLTALGPQAAEIYRFVSQRNQIVHEVSTRTAKFLRRSLSELQMNFDRQINGGTRADEDAQRRGLWRPEEESVDDRRRAAGDTVSWYQLLIAMSNNVFQVEHWVRRATIG